MAYARARYGRVNRFANANPGCCDGGTAPDICCGGVTQYASLRGDDGVVANATPVLKTAATVALTYHGYKRTGSLFWALVYGLAGKTVPLIAGPVAIAQGFGKRKEGC